MVRCQVKMLFYSQWPWPFNPLTHKSQVFISVSNCIKICQTLFKLKMFQMHAWTDGWTCWFIPMPPWIFDPTIWSVDHYPNMQQCYKFDTFLDVMLTMCHTYRLMNRQDIECLQSHYVVGHKQCHSSTVHYQQCLQKRDTFAFLCSSTEY